MRSHGILLAVLCQVALFALAQAPPAAPGLPPAPAAPRLGAFARTPEEAGRSGIARFAESYPGLMKGRVALGWDLRSPEADAAAKAAAVADARLRQLPDLGVTAVSLSQALDQVDPQTFSGVLWLEILRAPGGESRALSLVFGASGNGGETRMEIPFEKPLPPRPAPPEETPQEHILFKIPGTVSAAALSDSGDELWYVAQGKLFRRSMAGNGEVQEWAFSLQDDPGVPCVLRLFLDGESPYRAEVSWGGKGRRFAPRGKEPAAGNAFDGFPLSERESRFIKAPWLPEAGAYALREYQGLELGRFLDLVKIRAAGGESLLVLLKKDGGIGAFWGNSLEPLPPPAEGAFAALAGWQDLLAAAESADPHRIRIIRAASSPGWEARWDSAPLPGAACALCLGRVRGQTAALAFLPEGEETSVHLVPLPKASPEPPSR